MSDQDVKREILEGMNIAISNIHSVVDVVLESESDDAALHALMEGLDVTKQQALSILDLNIRRLGWHEREKLDDLLAEGDE